MKELSEDQKAFIDRFIAEDEDEDELFDEEEIHEARSSRIFWSCMTVLLLMPFVLSTILLYTLNRYEQLIGPGGLEVLSETLSSSEVDSMAGQTGIPELKFFIDVYEARHLIIASIFTAFFTLVAVMILGRALIYRWRTHG